MPDIKGANPGTLENYSSNFRTKASGNWEDAATWEFSTDNTNWVDATTAPAINATTTSVGHAVTVNAATTANALTIQSGKELTIASGEELTVTGTSANNGSIIIESGATLVGNIAGFSLL